MTENPPHTEEIATPDDPVVPSSPPETPARRLSVQRVSWSVTALAFLIAGVVLLVRDEYGYGIVTIVVALSAAINLL